MSHVSTKTDFEICPMMVRNFLCILLFLRDTKFTLFMNGNSCTILNRFSLNEEVDMIKLKLFFKNDMHAI